MTDFISNYKNQHKRKYIETPLPVQPILYPDEFKTPVRISPMTVDMETEYYLTLKTLFTEEEFPMDFVMFDNILPEIVFSANESTTISHDLLTIQDISFIGYHMRIQTIGDTMKVRLGCPKCRSFYNQVKTKKEGEDIEKLKTKYGIKNFTEQEMLMGEDFFRRTVEIPLGKYDLEYPEKREDVVKTYKTFSDVNLDITLPRYGWYNNLKPYLIDFRKVINEFLSNVDLSTEEKQEEQKKAYGYYSILQTSILAIDGNEVKQEDVQQIPIVLRKILNNKDLVNVTEILSGFSKYNLKIMYNFKCNKCGFEEVVDATSFPLSYYFSFNK